LDHHTWPEEKALLSPLAVPKRQLEFTAGRNAARDALSDLCQPAAPIGRGENGQPLWPIGVVGSVTHTGAIAVAVVGLVGHYRSLGIDVEKVDRSLSAMAIRRVCTDSELQWVYDDSNPTERCLRLFSAKEAVYKTLSPLGSPWLDYTDAELRWVESSSTFVARLLRPAGPQVPVGTTLTVHTVAAVGLICSATFVRP
jgi:4'-phosphopantetheinyl transferase EntD